MHAQGVYFVKLFVAALVSAVSLVTGSIEGVVASMLISPLGDPIVAIAPAIVATNFAAAAEQIVTAIASIAMIAVVGGLVRVWDGSRRVTVEMKKRMSTFDVRNAIMYAAVIGCVMSMNTLGGSSSLTLDVVGLAIAISILPPIVTAGILWVDQHRSSTPSRRRSQGMVNSFAFGICNIAGVIVGAFAVSIAMRRYSTTSSH